MAQTQSNRIQLIISAALSGGSIGLSSISSSILENIQSSFTADACDSVYTVSGTVAGGGSDSYDLAGALTNPLGQAVTFAEVMAVFVRCNTAAAGFTVGGATNILMLAAGDVVNLNDGAYFLWVNEVGIAVGAAASDLITITGTAGDTYDLIVIGSTT